MRVFAASAPAVMPSAAGARRAGGASFSVGPEKTERAAGGAAAVRTLGGIEALLALQAVEDPTERRRRKVARGRNVLDALDALKVGLLAGSLDSAAIARLRGATAGLEKDGDDPRLDAVLAEIELRAAVELAKLAVAQGRATTA